MPRSAKAWKSTDATVFELPRPPECAGDEAAGRNHNARSHGSLEDVDSGLDAGVAAEAQNLLEQLKLELRLVGSTLAATHRLDALLEAMDIISSLCWRHLATG